MITQFSRTQNIIGSLKQQKLFAAHVAVFGLGGVGSFTVESLARAGIGKISVFDNDTISLTNINRQLYALHSTIGKNKTDVAEQRILDINPSCKVYKYNMFFDQHNCSTIDFSEFDFVVDCIDTVKSKITIIKCAKNSSVPVISSMGTGNKLDPSKFQIADISKTRVCPLARAVRQELKKQHISKVTVLFSTEEPVKMDLNNCGIAPEEIEKKGKAPAPGSISFVPSVAGLMIGGFVIRELIK